MRPLQILITNGRMAKRTGTELYVFELALELLARGHYPVVYSPHCGSLADRLRSKTVPVVSRLEQLGLAPDIIHGHHNHPTLCACLHFPHAPAVFMCHSWNSWQDQPPRLARIRRYLAVDGACRDRMVCGEGIPEARVTVVPNFVNLARFQRRSPLPEQPRRALLFTNRAVGGFLRMLRQACGAREIELEVLGAIAGGACEQPEKYLGGYDVVFARGKAAIEALAVGAAVVVCDRGGLGALVTNENFAWQRRCNFGRRTFARQVTVEGLVGELALYSASDAAQVCDKLRACAPLSLTVDRLLSIYRSVIRKHAVAPSDPAAELKAVAGRLEQLRPILEAGWSRKELRGRLAKLRRTFFDKAFRIGWPFRRSA